MCFLCLRERKKAQNSSRQRVRPRKTHFLVWRVLGASFVMLFKAVAVEGPPPSIGHRLG